MPAASNKKLTSADIQTGAMILGVTPAHIKAIMEVETKGSGFDDQGLPIILFERHIMYKLTKAKYGQAKADYFVRNFPDIINPTMGGYGKYSEQQGRMDKAAKNIDRDIALQSASWGLGQVMGFNYETAGFKTLQSFVNAMYSSEGEQLFAMLNFINSNKKMVEALRKKDWAGFARIYNGPSYATNSYDRKLEAAYKRNGGI